MNILLFDTSTDTLAAGVLRDDGRLFAAARSDLKHSEILLPAIEGCLAAAELSFRDIDLIACAKGPGSFTGLRIGLATAKGLALALDIPWRGVPTLDCLAFGRGGPGLTVIPLLDARKNRVYAALYRDGLRISDYLDIAPDSLLALAEREGEAVFVGADADIFTDYVLERPGFRIEGDDPEKRLWGLAALAEAHYRDSGGEEADEGPLYLREPEIG